MLLGLLLSAVTALPATLLPPGPLFSGETQVTKGKLLGQISSPVSYILTFTIRPKGVVPDWSNILHFTTDDYDTTRVPGIFFWPGTSKLHVNAFLSYKPDGKTIDQYTGVDTPPLPVGCTTEVKIKVNPDHVYVALNGTIRGMTTFYGKSPASGSITTVYMSNPWYTPANAVVGNVDIIYTSDWSIPVAKGGRLDVTPNDRPIWEPAPLIKLEWNTGLGKIVVPQDWSLNFQLTPLGVVEGHGSILHFTNSNENCCNHGTRMPGIWFSPGSTKLFINVAMNTVVETPALPIGQESTVGIGLKTDGTGRKKLDVWVNGNQVVSQYVDPIYPVISGPAFAYLGDPWHTVANAMIRNVYLYDATVYAGDKVGITSFSVRLKPM